MPIGNRKKKFPRRPCQYSKCRAMFPPVVEHQRYCRTSHSVLACQERKFAKAVQAGVEKLRQQIIEEVLQKAIGDKINAPEAGSGS